MTAVYPSRPIRCICFTYLEESAAGGLCHISLLPSDAQLKLLCREPENTTVALIIHGIGRAFAYLAGIKF